MRSNVSKENFFVALKNGKFGIFRARTSLEQIRRHLRGLEVGHMECFYYDGEFEVYFDGYLKRVRLNLNESLAEKSNIKILARLQMNWVDYLMSCTPESLRSDIEEFGIRRLYLEDDYGYKGFHRFESPSALTVHFREDKPAVLFIEFKDEFECIRGYRNLERLN